jgi:O-antigen ligase
MATTDDSKLAFPAALAAFALVAVAVAVVLVQGTQIAALALAGLCVLPIVVFLALRWPLDGLFGFYVLLVPFDNLLSTGSFGTITKYLGLIAGAFLLLALVRRRQISFAGNPLRILCVLFLWMFASTLWALDQKSALAMLPTYGGLMLLYAVLSMIPLSAQQFRVLLFLVAAGGICAAAYGAHAFYSDPSFSQESLVMRRLVVQIGDNFIDPNHFSDALLFPVAIVTMWALRTRRLLVRLASIAALALLVVAIMFSGSREGLTALAVIGAYYLWRSRYRVRLAVAIAAVAAIAASVQTSVFERFSSALATGGSGRTSIWAVALEAAKHRPLQGYGIGNFTDAFNLFYLDVHQPYPYGWDSPAHNLIVHYLVELGLVGIVLIGAFLWTQFRSLRDVEPSSELYDYRIVMEAVLLAVVTVSMTIDLFQYKYAWLAFAMAALLRNAALAGQHSAAIRTASSAMMPERSARSAMRALPRSPRSRSARLSTSES